MPTNAFKKRTLNILKHLVNFSFTPITLSSSADIFHTNACFTATLLNFHNLFTFHIRNIDGFLIWIIFVTAFSAVRHFWHSSSLIRFFNQLFFQFFKCRNLQFFDHQLEKSPASYHRQMFCWIIFRAAWRHYHCCSVLQLCLSLFSLVIFV